MEMQMFRPEQLQLGQRQLRQLQLFVFIGFLTLYSPLSHAVSDEEFNALKQQLNLLADRLEAVSETNTQNHSSSGSTSIGGYGEMHYNSLSNPTGPRQRELDFHRFVLFFGHEFNDAIRFHSELELEHSLVEDTTGGSGPGEIELEQAYLEFDVNNASQIKAGVFLIPVGIINETHEPSTFYGTEHNPVEKNIIPATWWEGGVMVSSHSSSGLSYDLALTSGLNGGTDIRGGRQKVAGANANNLALTGRLKYTGIAGLELAGTLHVQDDITQDTFDNIDGATLIETHVVWNTGPFTLKTLFAKWDIDGSGASTTEEATQDGGYIEFSYKVTSSIGAFARHSVWDNGGAGDTEEAQSDIGFNYWPHEDVVIKLDYQNQNDTAGNGDGVNIGIGYQF
jgi:hypothetical protein